MTGADITLNQELNNYKCAMVNTPFVNEMNLYSNYITVLKQLLLSYDDNIWLKQANDNVLKKLMSWKDKQQ